MGFMVKDCLTKFKCNAEIQNDFQNVVDVYDMVVDLNFHKDIDLFTVARETINIQFDKLERDLDWSQRPLTEAQ